jgi:hypothetical protein
MTRTARPWPLSLRWVLLLAFGEATWWLLVDRRHDDFQPFRREIVGWASLAFTVYLIFVYAKALVQAARSPQPPKTPESRAFFKLSAIRAALLLGVEFVVALLMVKT